MTIVTIDEILKASESDLRAYPRTTLLRALAAAEHRLELLGDSLNLAIEEIENPDTPVATLAEHSMLSPDEDIPFDPPADWKPVLGYRLTDAEMEALKFRIRCRLSDMVEARFSGKLGRRQDFETFCWAWAHGCLSDNAGGVAKRPPVNPWPFKEPA